MISVYQLNHEGFLSQAGKELIRISSEIPVTEPLFLCILFLQGIRTELEKRKSL